MNQHSRIGSGFDLIKIKIYRFMNYHTPVNFNFEAPYIVISGPTGSGKTTILEALTFALFGRSSRLELGMVKIEDICGKKGYVMCLFYVSNNEIRIKRGRDSRGKSYLELFINKDRVHGKIPELNEKIRSTILGMNYQAFINSTIIRQDEMKSLGSKKSTERLKTLQNLFRLDIFEKAIINVQNQISIISNEKSRIEGALGEKELQYSKISQLEKDLKEKRPQLELSRKILKEIIQVIEKLEKDEKNKRKLDEQLKTIQSKQKDALNKQIVKSNKLKDLKIKLGQYLKLKSQLKELETKINDFKKFEDEFKSLKTAKKEFEIMNDHLQILKQNKQKIEGVLEEDLHKKNIQRKRELEKIKNLDTTLTHNEAFKILNQEGRLLERVQRISKEQTWDLPKNIMEEINEEQIQARKDMKELQKDKEKISKDSFVLSEKLEHIEGLNVEISDLEKRLKLEIETNTKEISNEEKKIREIDFTPDKIQKLKDLQNKCDLRFEFQQKFEEIKGKIESTIDPVGQIDFLQKELIELEREIKNYNEDLKERSKFLEDYNQLLNELDKKKKEKEELNNSIIRKEQEIISIEQKIKELTTLKHEIDQLKDRDILLRKEEDILQKLKTEIFHTSGVPFYAINKILPRLGMRASLILSEITNQRFSHIQLNKVEKGTQGIGFEILINAPDGLRDVSTFSGGERTQINAALRLAISEEISLIGEQEGSIKHGKKTLFIDEGDLGSLDTSEAQAAFVKKLFTLSNNFKIILITHLQEIADQFPYSINITRDSYGRSIKNETSETM